MTAYGDHLFRWEAMSGDAERLKKKKSDRYASAQRSCEIGLWRGISSSCVSPMIQEKSLDGLKRLVWMLNGICGFRITTLRDREREMRERL